MRDATRWAAAGAALLLLASCGEQAPLVEEIATYPLDGLDGVIAQGVVDFDPAVSSDNGGSLRTVGLAAGATKTVLLFETGDIDAEDCRLIYQAKLRVENVSGRAYLEMLCHFPERGEFFSRGLNSALTGTTDWTSHETMFFLRAGENPGYVKLNLVLEGTGTAWIDEVRLAKSL